MNIPAGIIWSTTSPARLKKHEEFHDTHEQVGTYPNVKWVPIITEACA